MAHIELSLPPVDWDDGVPATVSPDSTHPLGHWALVVSEAEEPCLLLDRTGVVLAISPSCTVLFGFESASNPVGRGLLDGIVDLVDFTREPGRLLAPQIERIPPLLALASGALARGLLRIRNGDRIRTLDAVAAPVGPVGMPAGSLTFFHRL